MTTTTTPEAEPQPLVNNKDVRLRIHRDPNGQTMTRTAVSWRISPALEEELAELGDTDPHILIVITHHQQEITRYVFPLRDQKAHISFHYSGTNLVYATVVSSKDSKKSPADYLMARQGGAYTVDVTRQVDDVLEDLREQRNALNGQISECDFARSRLKEKLEQVTPVPELTDEATADDIRRRQLLMYVAEAQMALMAHDGQSVDEVMQELERLKGQKASINEQIGTLNQLISEREANAQYHLEPCDEYWDRHPPASRVGGISVVEVDISKLLFARNWRITKWLAARLPWPTKALSGCLVRGRALTGGLLGLLMLPIGIPLSIINTMAVGFLAIFGAYDLPLRAILHPIQLNLRYLANQDWHSRWFQSRTWQDDSYGGRYTYTAKTAPHWFFNPLFSALGALFGLAAVIFSGVGLIWIVISSLLFIPLSILALIFPAVAKGPFARIGKAFDAWSDRRYQKLQRKLREDLERLALTGDGQSGLPLLPSGHRVRFVLTAGKNLVCKSVEGNV